MATVYLAREESGPEFGEEDEETLVMFASQAAMVVSNARRYREERRARADLETLMDTSPVGGGGLRLGLRHYGTQGIQW